MADSSPSNRAPAFETSTMSMNELRQPRELTRRLQSRPFEAVELTRYEDGVGVVVSPELWSFLLEAVSGRARAFRVPMASAHTDADTPTPYKHIIAREHEVAGPTQRWEVLVDGMPYELVGGGPYRAEPRPDYTQLLWKHHPEVAREILERFEWTEEHDQELTRHQHRECDESRHAWERGRALARALRPQEQGHGVELEDPWDDEPTRIVELESLPELVDYLAEEMQEALERHVTRDAGPGADRSMNSLPEAPHSMAEEVLHQEARELLERLGWELSES